MRSHLEEEMYGARVNKEALNQIANKQQEYNELVYTVFNTRAGKKLFKEFRKALEKPIFHEDTNIMYKREGERAVLLSLMDAYELGATK